MQLTNQLKGRAIESVWRHENALVIKCTDGWEVQVAWMDDHGTPLKGQPVVMFAGLHIVAKSVEVMHRNELRL